MTHRKLRTALAIAAASLGLAGCGASSLDTATATSGISTAVVTGAPLAGTAGTTGMSGSERVAAMTAMDGDGSKPTVDGYSLVKVTNPTTAGKAGRMSFVIDGPSGKPQTDFTLQQTKLLHLYVVRNDLTQFQHIHPTLDSKTGLWSVPVIFAQPGPYHMVIEFEALTPDGNFDDRILGTDFKIGGGKYTPVPYQPVYGKVSVDGYDVTLDPSTKVGGPPLQLKVTKAGADVTGLQPYLESFAHITGFREGDLKAVHVHPNEFPKKGDLNARGGPVLTLATVFAGPGKYRMFIEFQTNGLLHLTTIDIGVT
ncbi:MAG TPA: hypothetical protein VHV82_16070 [Sporichthyaceae bacterium]|jgi:hypothetical protein|nr:hypothetical protein [Sporichthyaceae bacterium]